MPKAKLAIILLAAAIAVAAQQTSTITAAEAKDHMGERATVCGQVVSTHLAARSRGTPTFLNLDKPYPTKFSRLSFGAVTAPSLETLKRHFGASASALRAKSAISEEYRRWLSRRRAKSKFNKAPAIKPEWKKEC